MNKKILKYQKNGYIFSKDVRDNNISTVYLTRMQKKGVISKVGRGIYVLNDVIEDEMYLHSLNYSNLVYTHSTALYLQGLSNSQLNILEACFPFGTNPTYIPVKCYVTRDKKLYELGIEYVETPSGNKVKCYDKERCICNLFLYDVYDDELKSYAIKEYKKNYLNVEKLYKYAEELGCYKIIKTIFEVLMCD